jgi:hypothetical protein
LRVLFFATNPHVDSTILLPILCDIQDIGHDLVLLGSYSMRDFSFDEIVQNGINYLTLVDSLSPSALSLSRRHYIEAYGDDINFVDCLYHRYVDEHFPVTTDYLYLDSPFYRQQYAIAGRIEQVIKATEPDLIIAWHGGDPFSKYAYCKAKKLAIPFMFCETSFFPKSYILDPHGMHFYSNANKVDLDWEQVKDKPLSDAQREKLQSYLLAWKSSRASKYSQTNNPEELKLLYDLVKENKKIVFYPGQVAADASVINGLDLFEEFDDILPFLSAALPDDWLLVHKVHPYQENSGLKTGRHGNTLIVKNISIHDLFPIADIVFTHSSTVGLEGLIAGKRVICSGRPIYARKGFTIDLQTRGGLSEALNAPENGPQQQEILERFLNYIVFSYVTQYGDLNHLKERIGLAETLRGTDTEKKGSPFCRSYPKYAKAYVEAIQAYNQMTRYPDWFEGRTDVETVDRETSAPGERRLVSLLDSILSLLDSRFQQKLEQEAEDTRRFADERDLLCQERDLVRHDINALRSSTAWRMTGPLRKICSMLRRVLRGG